MGHPKPIYGSKRRPPAEDSGEEDGHFGGDTALTIDEVGKSDAGEAEGGGMGDGVKDEERFLAAWADIIAGATMKEKTSAHFARNDRWG